MTQTTMYCTQWNSADTQKSVSMDL